MPPRGKRVRDWRGRRRCQAPRAVAAVWECYILLFFFFFQAEDGIRDVAVTGVQTCALPISVTLFGSAFHTASSSGSARNKVKYALLNGSISTGAIFVRIPRSVQMLLRISNKIGRASCRERV